MLSTPHSIPKDKFQNLVIHLPGISAKQTAPLSAAATYSMLPSASYSSISTSVSWTNPPIIGTDYHVRDFNTRSRLLNSAVNCKGLWGRRKWLRTKLPANQPLYLANNRTEGRGRSQKRTETWKWILICSVVYIYIPLLQNSHTPSCTYI